VTAVWARQKEPFSPRVEGRSFKKKKKSEGAPGLGYYSEARSFGGEYSLEKVRVDGGRGEMIAVSLTREGKSRRQRNSELRWGETGWIKQVISFTVGK